MADHIVISGLIVYAVIGVHAFEQSITHPLLIDVTFSADAARAAANDALSDTYDYAAVCTAIVNFVSATPCRLLETLAHRLAFYLKKEFRFSALKLSVTKKPKDMPHVAGVSVVVEC